MLRAEVIAIVSVVISRAFYEILQEKKEQAALSCKAPKKDSDPIPKM